MNEQDIHREEDTRPIGQLFREVRQSMGLSIREVGRRSGVSDPYLSQVERGVRRPGPEILKKLAPVYGLNLRTLMERAGHLTDQDGMAIVDKAADVERAYQYVLADPRFRFGARPRGEMSVEAKRFIVQMYESLTGKRVL